MVKARKGKIAKHKGLRPFIVDGETLPAPSPATKQLVKLTPFIRSRYSYGPKRCSPSFLGEKDAAKPSYISTWSFSFSAKWG